MKRSKIFLGVTTCLLAITGITAAKHFGDVKIRWYCTTGILGLNKHCVQTGPITCLYNSSKTFTCLFQGLAVFTAGATGPCFNCLHKFVYTRND